MRFTLVALASLAATAFASPKPQGVTEIIAPPTPAPAGCSPDYDGNFVISAAPVAKKHKRQLAGILTMTLKEGILKDKADRIGYIASNYQFQFDGPPQAGSIYTAGFSACSNATLALGGSAIWYQCLSGNFYNLYDRYWAAQCEPVFLRIKSVSGGDSNQGTATAEAPESESTPAASGEGDDATAAPSLSALSTPYDSAATATATNGSETPGPSQTAAGQTASPNSASATSTPTASSADASSSGSRTSTGSAGLASGNAAVKQVSKGRAAAMAAGAVGLVAML